MAHRAIASARRRDDLAMLANAIMSTVQCYYPRTLLIFSMTLTSAIEQQYLLYTLIHTVDAGAGGRPYSQ